MGVTERKARQKELLRQDILDAARQILLEEGLARLSVRRIAARIEYTPTTIYLYFKDKADLVFHLCEEVYGRVIEIVEAAAAGEQDPVRRVEAIMRAYIRFGLAEPDRYRIAFITDVSTSVDPRGFLKEGSMGFRNYDLVRQTVKDALTGGANPEEVESVTEVLWAMAHGIVSLLISHWESPWVPREVLIETGVNMAVEALRSRCRKG